MDGAPPPGAVRAGPGPAVAEPDLGRLFAPRSVVVVGATDRPGSYAAQTLLNLRRAGFAGQVAGVHPRLGEVLGVPCRPDLAGAVDVLGGPADAVVVATTAATVPDYLAEAGRLGCGGAVVFAGGFADTGDDAAQRRLVTAAGRHRLPVLGPNTNGLVSAHGRAPLWGDPVVLPGDDPDPAVALVTESGSAGLLALGHRQAQGLHSVVSLGNAAVVDVPAALANLAAAQRVRAVALYLERIPDGARLASALALCARADLRIAVLRTGRHIDTGRGRVLDALLAEAGAVACPDVHRLIETARALAGGRRTRRGPVVITSTAGDAALAADLAADAGVELPGLSPGTRAELASHLPRTAVPGNPLNHTTGVWADAGAMARITAAVAADPAVGSVLYVQDEPPGLHPDDSAEWLATREGVLLGAARADAGVLVVAGMPGQEPAGAVSGLPAALAAVAALREAAPDATRLARIAAGARRHHAVPTPFRPGPLAEHDAKAALDAAGIGVLRHAVVPLPDGDADGEAVATAVALAAAQIGFPVTVRLSSPGSAATPDAPGPAGGLTSADRVGRRVGELLAGAAGMDDLERCGSALLIEALARPGVALTMTAHRQGPVPALTVGLGGAWAQVLTGTRTVPLPAPPELVTRAAAALPGTATADLEAAGRAGSRLGNLLLEGGFTELRMTVNGGTAVRAQARR
ncbi:CoA-binding protein [Kineosporia corallincola]|nr:CoA-binding protein [Kineosporia corallincola]